MKRPLTKQEKIVNKKEIKAMNNYCFENITVEEVYELGAQGYVFEIENGKIVDMYLEREELDDRELEIA